MDLRNLWMPPYVERWEIICLFMILMGWRKLVQLFAAALSSWSGSTGHQNKEFFSFKN